MDNCSITETICPYFYEDCDDCNLYHTVEEVKQLAYQLEEMKEMNRNNRGFFELCEDTRTCNKICEENEECTDECVIQKAINKLEEYEDLEEQGLLLRLPFKVGDIIYEPITGNTINEYRVTGIKKEAFSLGIEWELENGFIYQNIHGVECKNIHGVEIEEIGKTVFLTKAEAEQKLKEMED